MYGFIMLTNTGEPVKSVLSNIFLMSCNDNFSMCVSDH